MNVASCWLVCCVVKIAFWIWILCGFLIQIEFQRAINAVLIIRNCDSSIDFDWHMLRHQLCNNNNNNYYYYSLLAWWYCMICLWLAGVISLLVSLLCYVTMWNSPADVGGTSYDGNGENKKDDRGIFNTEIHQTNFMLTKRCSMTFLYWVYISVELKLGLRIRR